MKNRRILSIILCIFLLFTTIPISYASETASDIAKPEQKTTEDLPGSRDIELKSKEKTTSFSEPELNLSGSLSQNGEAGADSAQNPGKTEEAETKTAEPEDKKAENPSEEPQAEEKSQPERDLQPVKEEAKQKYADARGEAGIDADFITRAVKKALEQEQPDMQSQEMTDFLKASNAYDALGAEGAGQLTEETVQGIQTVRSRISQVICSEDGITASSNAWYVKTNVKDGDDGEEMLEKIVSAYPGSSPKLLYYKAISYTDIRTGEPYQQEQTISLTFPVPEGYEQGVNSKVLTFTDGEVMDLSPDRDENGDFYIKRARTLTNILVVELPIGLTGITLLSKAGVNVGQTITLKAATVPSDITVSYSLEWKSSKTAVAKVNSQGKVTGVKSGTAVITASVKGNSRLKASCKVTVAQGAHTLSPPFSQVMKETRDYMLSVDTNPTVGSEWFVLGLARSGLDLNSEYFKIYYNHLANYVEEKKGILTNTSAYTEYARTILAITAIGKDAADVGGYNLLEPLADFDEVVSQGLNGPIWALIAYNSNPDYKIPKASAGSQQTTKEKLIQYILDNEAASGGWNLMGNSGDSDITGMALQALAPYYGKSGREDVTAVVDRALTLLGSTQNSTGGYSTMGAETSESCVQVITALCSLGIDPQKDARFIKGGYWTVENLLTYRIAGSGFMHVKPGADSIGGGAAGEVNGIATQQAYYAMTAYQRLLDGKTSLYDMSDLKLKPGGKGDGQGTGLEEPEPTPAPGNNSPGGTGKSAGGSQGNNAGQSGKKAASAKSVSSSKKSSGKISAAKKDQSDGWDFEAQEYQEEGRESGSGPSDDYGDAAGAKSEAAADKVASRRTIPVFAAGICLGGLGTGGGFCLWSRRKRKGEVKK